MLHGKCSDAALETGMPNQRKGPCSVVRSSWLWPDVSGSSTGVLSLPDVRSSCTSGYHADTLITSCLVISHFKCQPHHLQYTQNAPKTLLHVYKKENKKSC